MEKDRHLRNTFYLSVVECFWGFGMNVVSMGTILPVFLARCGADNATIALIPALSALGAGLPQSFSGLIARSGNRMRSWVLWLHVASPAPLMVISAWLLLGVHSKVKLVLTCWGIFYGFLGLLFPVWLEYMARVLDPARRGRAFGIIFLAQTLAGICGVAFASLLLRESTSDAAYAALFFAAWISMTGGAFFFLGTVRPPLPGCADGEKQTLAGHFRRTVTMASQMGWL